LIFDCPGYAYGVRGFFFSAAAPRIRESNKKGLRSEASAGQSKIKNQQSKMI
jgi:hypothetical protein